MRLRPSITRLPTAWKQAKAYASSKRLHVPFVYSSNGHQFVEFDSSTGLTGNPMPMGSFPTPADLRRRYEEFKGFSLDSEAAKPLLSPYNGGESQRRYYQDAAIRAALEKIAAGGVRALLTMATGSGKTFIAAHLLKKFADAGQLVRALFVCDREELRAQGLGALQAVFGADAAAASTANPQLNARVVVATYQTLGVDRDDDYSSFLTTHYPENYFSHIIIDEAHRSAWGKWSEVLTRNSNAVQIGLTATPREFEYPEDTLEAKEDRKVTADNIEYFGEPVYEYSIGQGIEDGYLAAMEVRKNDIFLNGYRESEAVTGIQQADLEGKTLTDATTGVEVGIAETRHRYEANSFEAYLMIPERVEEMCRSLFDYLLETGGPEQKTIIFCTRDSHAENVAIQMNNLYADWRTGQGQPPVRDYAFKCTAASGGADYLPNFGAAASTISSPQPWTCSPPASTCPASRTSSSSGTSTRPSPSTKWWDEAHACIPRPTSSCSASTTTPTPRACSEKTSRRPSLRASPRKRARTVLRDPGTGKAEATAPEPLSSRAWTCGFPTPAPTS